MTIQNFASFEADTTQTSATSKLVKAWEAKNAKRALKASGATLMAITLSACNGSGTVNTDTQNDGETQLNEDAGGPQVIDGVGTDTTPIRLTSNPDTVTFEGIAYAGRVWSPGGNVQTNSLNDDDIITGTGSADVLDVNLIDDSATGESIITPVMSGVETVNVAHTDQQAPNLDFEDVTGVVNVNVTRIEDEAAFVIDNMSGEAVNLSLDGSGDAIASMIFGYDRDSNDAADAGFPADGIVNLTLMDVTTTDTTIGITVDAGTEINLTVTDGDVDLTNLVIDDAETLDIDGESNLTIDAFSASAGVLSTIDASDATGDVDVNLGANDLVEARVAATSGVDIDFTFAGGAGDDTVRVDVDSLSSAPTAGGDAGAHDVIGGGAGRDTLDFTVANSSSAENLVDDEVTLTSIEEVRIDAQGTGTVTLDASLVGGLENVTVRNDSTSAQAVDVDVMDMAAGVSLSVQHSTLDANDDVADTVVMAHLADGTGTDDTMVVNIVSGTNTSETFDFTLDVEANDSDDVNLFDEEVENVTINDNDTENNSILLQSSSEHTGTFTLTGGRSGDTFVIDDAVALTSVTIDATAQLSDVTIDVGVANQDIDMGSGDDNVVFITEDTLTDDDDVVGGAGDDTITAQFTADSDSDLNVAGVEAVRLAADAAAGTVVTVDVSESDDITTIELMSDAHEHNSVDGAATDIVEVIADNISAINLVSTAGTSSTDTYNGLTITDEDSGNPTDMVITIDAADDLAAVVGVITLDAETETLTIDNLDDHNDTSDTTTFNGILAAGVTALVVTDAVDDADASAVYENVINLDDTTGLVSVDVTGAQGGTNLTLEALADNASINMVQSDDLEDDAADALTITYVGDTGADNVTITGGAAVETITITNGDMDNLIVNSGAGNDIVDLQGMSGENVEVDAGAGDDTITAGDQGGEYFGGAGADELIGGIGNDTMIGGAGADTFTFVAGLASDTIGDDTLDFTDGTDFLDFTSMGVDTVIGSTDTAAALAAAADESIIITVRDEGNDTVDEIDALFTSANLGDVTIVDGNAVLVTYDATDKSLGYVYEIEYDMTDDTTADDMAAVVQYIGTIDLGTTNWDDIVTADFVAVV